MVRWLLVLACLSCTWATARASGTERLREATEKWRQARADERPLEVYLRHIVAEDPNFNPDPGLALDKLDEEMQQIYDGLQYLLNPNLKAQFLGLSSDSLRHEWLRRYWRLRDPTPTTPENERKREHERRIEKARDHYGWKERPYWDARGRVYIMFGEPDSVISEVADVREGLGYIPASEEWLYVAENWVAQFQQPNPKGPWFFGHTSPKLSYRPDLVEQDLTLLGYRDPLNALTPDGRERMNDLFAQQEERQLLSALGPEANLGSEYLQHVVRTDLQAKDLLRKKSEAVRDFTTALEKGTDRFVVEGEAKRPLWYVFDVDVFKGSPGRMRVEVHYQFNLQDLTFQWQDSVYVARYRMEGTLLDRSIREAATDSYTETLHSETFRSTMSPQLLPGQLNFEVVPGPYRLAIRFIDLRTEDEGTYLTDVFVPDLNQEPLAVSDLQMATKIVYASDDWTSRFVKNDRLVIPNPIGVYRKDNQLTGYFEIYGLELDEEQHCRYQVSYSIVPRGQMRDSGWFPESEPLPKPFVESSFVGEGATSELVEELRIDIAALNQDIYDIILRIQDLNSGNEATTRGAFSILE